MPEKVAADFKTLAHQSLPDIYDNILGLTVFFGTLAAGLWGCVGWMRQKCYHSMAEMRALHTSTDAPLLQAPLLFPCGAKAAPEALFCPCKCADTAEHEQGSVGLKLADFAEKARKRGRPSAETEKIVDAWQLAIQHNAEDSTNAVWYQRPLRTGVEWIKIDPRSSQQQILKLLKENREMEEAWLVNGLLKFASQEAAYKAGTTFPQHSRLRGHHNISARLHALIVQRSSPMAQHRLRMTGAASLENDREMRNLREEHKKKVEQQRNLLAQKLKNIPYSLTNPKDGGGLNSLRACSRMLCNILSVKTGASGLKVERNGQNKKEVLQLLGKQFASDMQLDHATSVKKPEETLQPTQARVRAATSQQQLRQRRQRGEAEPERQRKAQAWLRAADLLNLRATCRGGNLGLLSRSNWDKVKRLRTKEVRQKRSDALHQPRNKPPILAAMQVLLELDDELASNVNFECQVWRLAQQFRFHPAMEPDTDNEEEGDDAGQVQNI